MNIKAKAREWCEVDDRMFMEGPVKTQGDNCTAYELLAYIESLPEEEALSSPVGVDKEELEAERRRGFIEGAAHTLELIEKYPDAKLTDHKVWVDYMRNKSKPVEEAVADGYVAWHPVDGVEFDSFKENEHSACQALTYKEIENGWQIRPVRLVFNDEGEK